MAQTADNNPKRYVNNKVNHSLKVQIRNLLISVILSGEEIHFSGLKGNWSFN